MLDHTRTNETAPKLRHWGACLNILIVLVIISILSGCLSPIAMQRAVIEYDRTVSYVEADLLLLNIARARHHRPVHFTAVSSVAATFDFRTSAGIRGGFGPVADSRERPLNLEYSASVAENPTITIVPITGEEFTKRVLRRRVVLNRFSGFPASN